MQGRCNKQAATTTPTAKQKLTISAVVLAALGGVSSTVAPSIYYQVYEHTAAPVQIENATYAGSHSPSTSQVLELNNRPVRGHYLDSAGAPSLRTSDEVQVGAPTYVKLNRPANQPEVRREINFTLVGKHYHPIQIIGMKARVVARRQPLAGTLLYVPVQGGSADANIGFDLDSDRLDARLIANGSLSTRNYFDEKQMTLSRDERVTFDALVLTSTCRCEFVIDMKLADGSVITINDNGRPWGISAFSAHYERSYVADVNSELIRACGYPLDCFEFYSRHPNY